jgi:hypothetical protein
MLTGEVELITAVLQQWIKDSIRPDSDAWWQMEVLERTDPQQFPVLCWVALITGKEPAEVLQSMMEKVRYIRLHPEQEYLARYEHPVLRGNAKAHEKGDFKPGQRKIASTRQYNLARKQKQKESALALAATG